MRVYFIIAAICLSHLISLNSYGQDTIQKFYRPWIINYRVYAQMSTVIMRHSPIVKVVDFGGHTRFVGQVWSDCGNYNGVTKEYFRNGKTKSIKTYSPNVANGCPLKNGTWVYYHKDGSLRKEVVYKQGKKQIE